MGDLANGIFAVTVTAYLFGVDIQWWHMVIAMMISLLPDIDALPELWLHGAVGRKQVVSRLPTNHRSLLHYPALHFIVGLGCYAVNQFWGATYLITIGLHFLRDVLGTGWGVKLFWPVSSMNYKFMSADTSHRKTTQGFADSEIPELASTHGNSNWLEDTYLRLTWISIIEYTLFVIAIGVALWHLLY